MRLARRTNRSSLIFADLPFKLVNVIIVVLALLLGLAYLAAMPPAAQRTRETDAIECSMLLLLMLIASPLAFGYLFAFPLLPLVVCTRIWLVRPDTPLRWWALAAVILLALTLPFQRSMQRYGNTLFATLLLFIGLAIELRRLYARPGSCLTTAASQRTKKIDATRNVIFDASPRPIAKCDRDFLDPQTSPAVDNDFESNLETSRGRRQLEQERARDGKETAHGIVRAGQRIGQGRGGAGHHFAPERPAGSGAAAHVTTADDHFAAARCSGRTRSGILDGGWLRSASITTRRSPARRTPRRRPPRETEGGIFAHHQADGKLHRQLADARAGSIGRAIVDKDDFQRVSAARHDPSGQQRDVFRFIQRRDDNRDRLGKGEWLHVDAPA